MVVSVEVSFWKLYRTMAAPSMEPDACIKTKVAKEGRGKEGKFFLRIRTILGLELRKEGSTGYSLHHRREDFSG